MGNILGYIQRLFTGKDDGGGGAGAGDHYPTPRRPHCQLQGPVSPRIVLPPHGSHGVAPANVGVHPWSNPYQPAVPTSRPHYQPESPVRTQCQPQGAARPHMQSLGPHGVTPAISDDAVRRLEQHILATIGRDLDHSMELLPNIRANAGVAALSHDLRSFEATTMPQGAARPHKQSLGPHGATPANINGAARTRDILAAVTPECVGDAYVDTADPRESTNMPPEVCKAVIAKAQPRKRRKRRRVAPLKADCMRATRANAGVTALAHDLRNFEATSMVPERLGQHVRSSKRTQAKWYRKILEAYKDKKPPPKTPIKVARLLATALSRIQRHDLEGILKFYGLPVPALPTESSGRHPSALPDLEGDQFVLHTLPVNAECVGDGDGFTAYVDTADPRESANMPPEVKAVLAKARSRKRRNRKRVDALQHSVSEAGYCWIQVGAGNKKILAKKYKIRMMGIDAPELQMPYGKESKNALVELIEGKCVTIYVYGTDKYKRYVGDIYCDSVFIQEKMLRRGFAMHYKTYDDRPELAQWERKAKAARRGLWASENPEKPWEWRTKQRNAGIRVH